LLRTRTLSALVLIPIALLAIRAGGWWLLAALLLAAGLAAYEFGRLVGHGGYTAQTPFTLAIVGALLLDAQLPDVDIIWPALTWLLMLSISWQLFQAQDKAPTVNWALTVAGGLYIGMLAAHGILLRALPAGLAWILLAMLVTWAGDTAAYLVGSHFGRHKLWRRISPGKTWEGLAGGVITSALVGALAGSLAMRWMGAIGPWHGAVVGFLAGVVGLFGDLAISLIKRHMNVKDSGHIIPGHGGILDRTDSLFFAMVVTYYYALWVAGG
jgi:phosphatidate cytidylyltransferase